MGGLALLAREKKYQVSGCDENVYPPMSEILTNEGINLVHGYNLRDLPEADTYIIGNALSRGNPLIEYLLDNGADKCWIDLYGNSAKSLIKEKIKK